MPKAAGAGGNEALGLHQRSVPGDAAVLDVQTWWRRHWSCPVNPTSSSLRPAGWLITSAVPTLSALKN